MQPSQYKYTKIQYRFAVIYEAPRTIYISYSNSGREGGKEQLMKIYLSTLMGEVREGRLSSWELMLRESFRISPIDGNPTHDSSRCLSCPRPSKSINIKASFRF